MVVVETLFLIALVSAFVGLVALLASTRPQVRASARLNGIIHLVIVASAAIAIASLALYAVSPHEAARQSAYGVNADPPAGP
jgi:hypothetical protein